MAIRSDQAIVVGGGSAGVSAATTILENGGRVVLLDKSFFSGGNLTKATSGIKGADTGTQRERGIKGAADEHFAFLVSESLPVAGLHAAGEVAGGVHRNNRLGGNSPMDCVVLGREAGAACAKWWATR